MKKFYAANKPWIIQGAFWGFFMFIVNTLLFPLSDDEPFKIKNILAGILIWTIAGFLFGYTMKLVNKKTNKTPSRNEKGGNVK